jgi:hypothetical protein
MAGALGWRAMFELFAWALDEIWPLAVTAIVVVYLVAMARMAEREPTEMPKKPASLEGYDVEWCPTCSVWVPAKTPWCGVKGCARPHRTL